MGIKNIYERFIWFDSQVKSKKYPNATFLANRFEISTKTAQRDIEFMRDRLFCPFEYDASQKGYYYVDETFTLPNMDDPEDGQKPPILGLLVLLALIRKRFGKGKK
jgi:predicted DNA-binding transcriptional regulator YafY